MKKELQTGTDAQSSTTLIEEEVNDVYTVTITGFCNDRTKIQYKSQLNLKYFSESIRDKKYNSLSFAEFKKRGMSNNYR